MLLFDISRSKLSNNSKSLPWWSPTMFRMVKWLYIRLRFTCGLDETTSFVKFVLNQSSISLMAITVMCRFICNIQTFTMRMCRHSAFKWDKNGDAFNSKRKLKFTEQSVWIRPRKCWLHQFLVFYIIVSECERLNAAIRFKVIYSYHCRFGGINSLQI